MSETRVSRFAAVRGHDRVIDYLRKANARDHLAHALLFAGPDGIGKRTVALGFAAFLQCEARTDDACGECASCAQVAAGSHPDVQAVAVPAGKKEIGVERIRELKRFMQMRPVRGRAKVAVIDDAQMLTVAAQNALLKTLEEPPPHSFLVLVVNNLDALLPTVRSRCQPVRFAPLPTDAVVDILTTVHSLAIPTARQVAALADGSPGRALQLSRHLTPDSYAELTRQLATLGDARYGALMRFAHELNHPDTAATMKLEVMLAHFGDEALRSVGAGSLTSTHDAITAPAVPRAALRRADLVHETWTAIRRGNPNRQLLLEALLLQLARS